MIAYKVVSNLEEFYKTIPKDLVDEIFLVDNSSNDGTFELAQKLGIVSYRNHKNLGYGGNLKRAIGIALDHGADIVIDIHPDGEYKASAIFPALEEIKKGSQFVLGNRFSSPKIAKSNGMFAYKVPPLFFLNWLCRKVLGLSVHDLHQGFRVYTREMLENIDFKNNSNNYIFSFEIIIQAVKKRIRITEVPIEVHYSGKKRGASLKNSIMYSLGVLRLLFQFSFDMIFKRYAVH